MSIHVELEGPYRVPAPAPPDPYLLAWTDVRRLGIRGGCVFWASIPLMLISFVLLPHFGVSDVVARAVAIGLGVPLLPTGLWMRFQARCPHCSGHIFQRGRFSVTANGRICPHCGIRVGTPKSEVEQVAEVRAIDQAG